MIFFSPLFLRCRFLALAGLVALQLIWAGGVKAGDAPSAYLQAGLAAYDQGAYPQAAMEWKKGAEAGDLSCARNLAHLYRWGKGISQDWNRAADLYAQAAQARQGRAEYNLGMMYALGGPDFPIDRDKAIRWLVRASKAGQEAARQALEHLDGTQAVVTAPELASPSAPLAVTSELAADQAIQSSTPALLPQADKAPDTLPQARTTEQSPTKSVAEEGGRARTFPQARAHIASFKAYQPASSIIPDNVFPQLERLIVEVDLGDRGHWFRLYVIGSPEDIAAFCAQRNYCDRHL